jgi:hypothetical protein
MQAKTGDTQPHRDHVGHDIASTAIPRLVRPADHFRITREWLHNFPNWTRAALEVVGIDTDQPPKGWVRALCGRTITEEQRRAFERAARPR